MDETNTSAIVIGILAFGSPGVSEVACTEIAKERPERPSLPFSVSWIKGRVYKPDGERTVEARGSRMRP